MEQPLSYQALLKKRGVEAALHALLIIGLWMLANNYLFRTPLHGPARYLYVIGFFLFAAYFTWKPRWLAKSRRESE